MGSGQRVVERHKHEDSTLDILYHELATDIKLYSSVRYHTRWWPPSSGFWCVCKYRGKYSQKLGRVTPGAHHVFADSFPPRQFRFFLSGFLNLLQVCGVLFPNKATSRDLISLFCPPENTPNIAKWPSQLCEPGPPVPAVLQACSHAGV